jgi:serine/threonine protein kinase
MTDSPSVVGLGSLVKEGWCKKQGGHIKTWKKRWFILRGTTLLYFTKKGSSATEKGRLNILLASCILSAPECKKQPAFKIGYHGARTYYVTCESRYEADVWIEALQSVRPGQSHSEPKLITPDDFDYLRTLGRGSYGLVQLVRHKKDGQLYAMKSMNKQSLAAEDQIDQILAERAVLLRAVHPFLVGAHFTFQTDTQVFLVLDYVPGGELFRRLTEEGMFPAGRARLYAAEILLGLGHLHANGLIYRDLKPENILIDADGHVRITDFGLVKPGLIDSRASTATFCGTPQYMAPEIIRHGRYTKAVDWWAFGILLYEMLIGLPTFWDDNRDALFRKVMHDRVRFPVMLSPEAEDLILRLLDRDPWARLGAGEEDCNEIKRHPFFRGVFWPAILEKAVVVEWTPVIRHPTDVSNFDEEFTQGGAGAYEEADQPPASVQSAFAQFSFTNESRIP